MHRLRTLGRGGRLLLALAAGAAVFGIATAVQADIPDNGVIHGCYGKPGTPYKGNLRVRDASAGEQCHFYENTLDWNQVGPTGARGPTGPSDLWQSNGFGQEVALTSFLNNNVATLSLPAGNFSVIAKVGVTDIAAATEFSCTLIDKSGVGTVDESFARTTAAFEEIDVPLQTVLTFASPASVELSCTATDNVNSFARNWKMQAIKIGTVH
jgi:hypothetical protein